jgi:signal transduction histidine kinase/ligand-binding sensor domain-containing protein
LLPAAERTTPIEPRSNVGPVMLAAGMVAALGMALQSEAGSVGRGSSGAGTIPSGMRAYGVRDGLIHERVNGFLEDRHGFLWIATWEGASRFDGRAFVSYGTSDGLRSPLVWSIGESPTSGRIWLGTSTGGLARLASSSSSPAFEPIDVAALPDDDTIERIAFGPSGDLYAATPLGVVRCERPDDPRPTFELAWRSNDRTWGAQALVEIDGWVWVVGALPLVGMKEGELRRLPAPPGQALAEAVHSDPRPDGGCLVATSAGLFALEPAALRDGRDDPWRRLDVELPFDEKPHALAWSSDGTIWIATVRGLLRVAAGDRGAAHEGPRSRERIDASCGLPDEYVRTIAFDRAGTLWIGTQLAGFVALGGGPIESFRPAAFLAPLTVIRVVEAADGSIAASAVNSGLWRVRGRLLERVPGSESGPLRDSHMRVARAPDGRFWIGGADGLYRTRGPELSLDGLERLGLGAADTRVTGEIFFDHGGGGWLGGVDGELYHAAPGEPPVVEARGADFPSDSRYPPRAFAEDAGGRLWIAPADRLWRRRDDGRFEALSIDGLPDPPRPRALVFERDRCWVGTRYDGLFELALDGERPRVASHVSTRDGLPSDFVSALVLDDSGALWCGTGRGLVRRDPATGALRRFGPEDGLAGSTINHLMKDHAGFLWAGAAGGLSRVDPRALAPAAAPPRLYVARVEAGGTPLPLASRGLRELAGVELPSGRRDLVVEFTGVDLSGGSLLFEQRLEGAGARGGEPGFGPPHAESTVRFDALAPGRYVLTMRARRADGVGSEPARVAFVVPAPLWQRPWFLALAAAAAAAVVAAWVRARVRRALSLERVRTEIATDLHDDAGANLAQIAILAEVARRDLSESARDGRGDAAAKSASLLADVAELARATRASIADLVWAVDPRRDSLRDLVQRVRQAAVNLFEPAGVRLDFRAPPSESLAPVDLDPATRRHLLFLLQELLHNAARHAEARKVEVEFALAGDSLAVRVRDDGRGFDPSAGSDGHGIASARRRSGSLGGTIEWRSAPGQGTEVRLDLRLGGGGGLPRILGR